MLFFFISTKMLPIVGAIIPLFIIARDLHVLDSQKLLIVLYCAMNLPIAVWMLRSFLLEVPAEVIEASRVDGAGVIRQLRSVIMPVISPGLAATALICFIFAWNEFFLAVNLTTIKGATVPDLPGRLRSARGPVHRPPLSCGHCRLPSRAAGGLGSAGQARAWPVDGCGQVRPVLQSPL